MSVYRTIGPLVIVFTMFLSKAKTCQIHLARQIGRLLVQIQERRGVVMLKIDACLHDYQP